MKLHRKLIYWAYVLWEWKWLTLTTSASIIFLVWLGLVQPRYKNCVWGLTQQYCEVEK